jgi:hypothetical protein
MKGESHLKKEETMTKEKFLTVHWNNWLTLGLGLPSLIFIAWAYSSGVWRTLGGMIGLSIIGVLY